jgi:5-(aminomethyl)-3-furanmethanol phosphate kinase
VLTVVKVGGGLARAAGDGALRRLCDALGEAGTRHPMLVVPGGGELADAVRDYDRVYGLRAETAHRMAILAMDQLGWALADRIPGAVRRSDLDATDGVSVLLPAALLAAADPLPASWDVTSDSIAAWVAGAAGARRLVLVKPVPGLAREQLTVDQLAALRPPEVDRHLPHVLYGARFETWVIDGREPVRLTELLDRGATAGTRISIT